MLFNPIIVPVRNNVSLTRKAIKTFKAQDIYGGIYIVVVNNQSTDGTNEYLQTQTSVANMYFDPPQSVAASWNRALDFVFRAGAEYALVVNNDVELLPQTYRLLVEDGGPFVTAVGTKTWPTVINPPDERRPHPDFSCFLIRKDTYIKVGPFDEQFLMAYCEDLDYHIRMHQAGIRAYCINYPFLHHVSGTINSCELKDQRIIHAQAERNREYFKKKWGFAVASPEYYAFFK